jgi:hypothetical protein
MAESQGRVWSFGTVEVRQRVAGRASWHSVGTDGVQNLKNEPIPADGSNEASTPMDRPTLRQLALLVLTPLVTIVASSSAAGATRPPAHKKAQAEVNVLHAVVRISKTRQIPELVDPRTHLLVDNTQAICRGRGKRYAGRRYTRFVCVIRPSRHRPRQGLRVSYRALPKGHFRVHWLAYKR